MRKKNEKENFSIPIDSKSTTSVVPIVDDLLNSWQNKSNPNNDKINAPGVDTIIEALVSAKDIRETDLRSIARKHKNRVPPRRSLR